MAPHRPSRPPFPGRLAMSNAIVPKGGGFVYVCVDGHDNWKIGRSANPRRRVANFNTPTHLRIEKEIWCPDPAWLEHVLHAAFKSQRLRGEWFRLGASDVELIRSIPAAVSYWQDLPAPLQEHGKNRVMVLRNNPDWSDKRDRKSRMPALCLHRSSGLAYVTDPRTKREVYFGRPGEAETALKHAEWCREFLRWREAQKTGQPTPFAPKRPRGIITVAKLCSTFLDFAEKYYVKHGKQTSEVAAFRGLFVRLNRQAGKHPAASYGPKDLAHLRDRMAEEHLSRDTVNALVRRLRRVWRWAVAEELLPAECLMRLQAVPGLKKGRSKAREPEPVRPVEWAVVEATLPYLHPRLRALVLFQLHGAMRPGEAPVVSLSNAEAAQILETLRGLLDRLADNGVPVAPPSPALPQYVTLDQAAAMVHRRKRTLYHHPGRPGPAVAGGHGRAALYDWAALRPWLLSAFGVPLPERFPGY